ncbi:sulfotransferase family protein [Thalassotalea sp. G2M2-11]|uniref:sulfotransferase family protein n=1 Tax=Thalassotalea sp. G2M2-11 TaxID=2787627 RepID=UPI0019D2A6F1|nr:sulfotransferase family protein [Thalassotalea sp. G2M2-11]
MAEQKIFIIGLPRTGTTSVCSKFLALGYRVAHTAYTQQTFEHAQVIADTPVFNDFKTLDNYYPDSKFIYLTRDINAWLPSIKQLLQRMYANVIRHDGGFNPIIKRCYQQTFAPFTEQNINNDDFLIRCYQKHQQQVTQYFADKPAQLFTFSVTQTESFQQLHDFLQLPTPITSFNRLNIGGKITAWKELSHPNKIASTRNGKTTTLDYLQALSSQDCVN